MSSTIVLASTVGLVGALAGVDRGDHGWLSRPPASRIRRLISRILVCKCSRSTPWSSVSGQSNSTVLPSIAKRSAWPSGMFLGALQQVLAP